MWPRRQGLGLRRKFRALCHIPDGHGGHVLAKADRFFHDSASPASDRDCERSAWHERQQKSGNRVVDQRGPDGRWLKKQAQAMVC
jgi:hypothetical protein